MLHLGHVVKKNNMKLAEHITQREYSLSVREVLKQCRAQSPHVIIYQCGNVSCSLGNMRSNQRPALLQVPSVIVALSVLQRAIRWLISAVREEALGYDWYLCECCRLSIILISIHKKINK